MITGIDHVVVPWPDLDEGVRIATALGFTVTAGGRHAGLGTANAMIEFPSSFIELVGVVDEAQAEASGSPGRLRGSAGVPVSYLLRSSDLDSDLGRLRSAGLDASGPVRYERVGDDGTVHALLVATVTAGSEEVLFALVEPQGGAGDRRWVSHDNGAVELAGVRFASRRWRLVMEAYTALGASVAGGADGFEARVGAATVRIAAGVTPGVLVGVRSVSRTASYLATLGVPFSAHPDTRSPRICTVSPWRGRDLSYLSFVGVGCPG